MYAVECKMELRTIFWCSYRQEPFLTRMFLQFFTWNVFERKPNHYKNSENFYSDLINKQVYIKVIIIFIKTLIYYVAYMPEYETLALYNMVMYTFMNFVIFFTFYILFKGTKRTKLL